DGKLLILLTSFGIQVCDVATGKHLQTLKLAQLPVLHRIQAMSPDGRRLVLSGSRDLQLWDVQTGKQLARREGMAGPAAFSPDGRRLACGTDQALHLLEPSTLKDVRVLATPIPGAGSFGMTFSRDGKRLALLAGGSLQIWDLAGGKPLHPFVGHLGT